MNEARYRTHRTIKPFSLNDYYLRCAAEAMLVGEGKISEEETYAAHCNMPFLLKKLEELDHYQFMHALEWYTKPNKEWIDRKIGWQIYCWYTRESIHKNKYPLGQYNPESLFQPPKPKPATAAATTNKRKHVEISEPANGYSYSEKEQLDIIKKYPKRSPERAEVMRMFVNINNKSRATLYRRLKEYEKKDYDNVLLQLHEFPKRMNLYEAIPQLIGLGYEGDYIRSDIRHIVNWKGRICLLLIPVSFVVSEQHMDDAFNQKPYRIDIVSLIGNSDLVCRSGLGQPENIQDPNNEEDEHFKKFCQEKKIMPLKWKADTRPQYFLPGLYQCGLENDMDARICKLYFPPSVFPPPSMIDDTQQSMILCSLQKYIQDEASLGHSPITCVGSNNDHEKRFRCKYWNRRSEIPEFEKTKKFHPYNIHSCTFSFVVRWDQFGYYIPLLKNKWGDHNMGCAWHCCDEE